MSQQWFEVQRHLNRVQVARQHGVLPQPEEGEVLLKMLACGICGADIRVVTGNKIATGDPKHYTTLGHEGVGRIVDIGEQGTGLCSGDCVVVLPHRHIPGVCHLAVSGISPACIGNGHTLHMGWDLDGCFADFLCVPTTNIVRVEPESLQLARRNAPGLGEAVFAWVEPMLCVLSAYELIETQLQTLMQRDLKPGRALVIGCGPIGILHSLILLERGFEVCLMDTLPKRAELAQWCLYHRVQLFDATEPSENFDLVMVTASSSEAIRTGEAVVRNGGIVYVFAGLNAADRRSMDRENLFFYERLHRTAKGVLTTTRLTNESKVVFYLGHSGYFEKLAQKAIQAVAVHSGVLDRAVTGIIPGFSCPQIISRLPGGSNWTTENEGPALISVLEGMDLREWHCKLLLMLSEQTRSGDSVLQWRERNVVILR